MAVIPQVWRDFPFQKGMVIGMQSQELDGTPCINSLASLQETWVSSYYQLDFTSYATAVFNKGNTPTDMGFLISMYEFVVDITLVYFNFYTDCKFELLLISLGQLLSKSSSAFNYSNAVGFLMYEYYNKQANSPIMLLDQSTANFVYASATDTEK